MSPPPILGDGTRWIAAATAAVTVTTVGVALRSAQGPRPVPLLTVGLLVTLAGLALDRQAQDARRPLPGTLIVIGAVIALLGLEAALDIDADTVDVFLAITGTSFIVLGLLRDDRRPMAIGVLQWASALARPDGETWTHCLVARDIAVPLPRLAPLVLLGLLCLLAAAVMRGRDWRHDAGRGLETVGLALFLGALVGKALELPGHPSMCGTGDAIDLGWAVVLFASAALVAVVGAMRQDRLWAASALATFTLFAIAATTLEQNPWWGIVAGVPLLALLVWLDLQGTPWARHHPKARP